MSIPNYSKRDPIVHLLGAMAEGTSGYIENMEAAGQRELVNSDRVPTQMGDRAEYEALGFVFGDIDEGDPLFRQATLPPGWRREATSHSMGSSIVDERGVVRVSIFYKAAFYDRSASMTLIRVGSHIASSLIYGDAAEQEKAEAQVDVLTHAELDELIREIKATARDILEYPDIYGRHQAANDKARLLVERRLASQQKVDTP